MPSLLQPTAQAHNALPDRARLGIPDRIAEIGAFALGEMPVPTEVGRTVRYVIAALLIATLALPSLEARAASDLYPGAPAVVSSLSAPYASIRTAPDPLAAEMVQVDNGISPTIIAGPLAGTDGLLWYQIEVSGLTGYIAEADLAWGVAEEVTTPEVEPAPAPPVVTGNGVVISTDGADIGCLAAPAWEAAWLFTYSSGSLVDKTGEALDGWQPVICAGQLGYLPASLVFDPSNLPAPEPTEVATEVIETATVVETEEATEVIETATVIETVEATEIPEATETIVLPEETSTEIAEPTVTDVVIEETPTAEVTETETPAPVDTEIIPEETATEVIVTETATIEITATVVEETPTVEVGQTIPEVVDSPVVQQSISEVVSASIVSTAVVYNTGGGGLRCRSGASLESPVLIVLPLGAQVSLTGADSNGWTPVVCGTQAGFVASRFLQASGEETIDEQPVEPSAALTGATGVVQNTDGDGVRCRSGASLTASIITVLAEGTSVASRGSAVGVWQPVTCAGRAGFVHTDFLGNVSNTGGTNGGGTGGTGAATGVATVSGTNGDGVRFRASAGYDGAVIAVLSEGTTVTLRNGSSGSWIAITSGGRNGFVYGDYLSRNSSGGGTGGNTGGNSGVGGTNLGAGSNARVNDTLNFRSDASYSATVLGVAAVGTVVRVTGSPVSGFYPVQWGGVSGYMHGDYLSYTTAALSTTGPYSGAGGSTGGGAGAGNGLGSATGQSLVDVAMRYLGYPYVWATHGPNSFDCSGFTYWVVINVLGRDIGAGTWTQWGTGTPIQYGSLQPGDLVFFQNTYTVGLSHVGMYIGNDQFIHAENENTGVRISSLSSNYYSTRYLGARRLT
ncbi:MAG: SH3 domain-containing protein [Thermomicrobiales bacterium]